MVYAVHVHVHVATSRPTHVYTYMYSMEIIPVTRNTLYIDPSLRTELPWWFTGPSAGSTALSQFPFEVVNYMHNYPFDV